MQTRLNPYLNFNGTTRQAMEFYRTVFGGDLELHTYEEYHASDESENNKIMHAMLQADDGFTFMAADTPNGMDFSVGTNFNMSLNGDDGEELRTYFGKLAEGGAIIMPLDKAPWGDIFGMCTDKFGISWMVNIAG